MSTVYTLNGKVLKNAANDKWLTKYVDPLNPYNLPANTMRFKVGHGDSIEFPPWGYTLTLVSESEDGDIYDYHSDSFKPGNPALSGSSQTFKENTLEILGMNSDDTSRDFFEMTSLRNLTAASFGHIDNVVQIQLGSQIDNAGSQYITTLPNLTFTNNNSISTLRIMNFPNLTEIPDWNIPSSIRSIMFRNNPNVETGALRMYNRVKDYDIEHDGIFKDCGSNTVTGAAELAQIPSSWGGTGA